MRVRAVLLPLACGFGIIGFLALMFFAIPAVALFFSMLLEGGGDLATWTKAGLLLLGCVAWTAILAALLRWISPPSREASNAQD